MEIDGRIALVTGAASGIGRATALRLSREGADVIVADIDDGRGAEVATELGGHYVHLDVRDPAAWATVVEGLVAERGRIDIGVLNAGLLTPMAGERGSFAGGVDIGALRDDDYRRVTAVNIDGVVFGARALARVMADSGGALVATASVAGLLPFDRDPIYTMTKHAVVGFVRAFAPSLASAGITLSAVCPAIVRTDIVADHFFDQIEQAGAGVMDPSVVAEAIHGLIISGACGETRVCLDDSGAYPVGLPSFERPA